MGGQLIIKSQFGKGSEFSFTLPIKLAEFSKPEVDNKTISREVLIVHGPKEDLRFLNNIFKLMNMVVSTVSINEVLKIDIKKHPFDLMVFFPGELTPSLDLIKWASSIKIPKILMMRQHSESILKEWNNLNISNVFLIPFTRKAFQDEMFSKNRTLKTGDTDKEKVVSSGYRLLVIDDNKINRQSLAIILNKAGFMTSTARNGLEALDLIKENDYDLILLDIKMPVMDGYQLAKAIRKMGGKYLDILIIALTANAIKSVFEEAISAGMNGMISKPVQPEALLKTIESHLQKNQTREKIDLSFIQIPNELVVFDTTNFLGRFGDSKNLVIELATAYLEDYHADLKKIEKAILAQDIKGIDDTIHYFIGSCSNVGAERLLWVAKTIKNEAKNGILLSMKALYRMMDQEAEKFAGTFSDWLEERKRSL
jgi:CheY-like chemotaxis protein